MDTAVSSGVHVGIPLEYGARAVEVIGQKATAHPGADVVARPVHVSKELFRVPRFERPQVGAFVERKSVHARSLWVRRRRIGLLVSLVTRLGRIRRRKPPADLGPVLIQSRWRQSVDRRCRAKADRANDAAWHKALVVDRGAWLGEGTAPDRRHH